MTLSKKKQATVRNQYLSAIISELMGPGSERISKDKEHEIINEKPESHYVTGILYPKDVESDSKVKVEFEDSTEDWSEPESAPAIVDNSFKPTTIGLSFYCNPVKEIQVRVKGATYSEISNPPIYLPDEYTDDFTARVLENAQLKDFILFDKSQHTIRFTEDAYQKHLADCLENLKTLFKDVRNYEEDKTAFYASLLRNSNLGSRKSYVRHPFNIPVNLSLSDQQNPQKVFLDGEDTGLLLHLNVLKKQNTQILSPTVVLENTNSDRARTFFQCELSVESSEDLIFKSSEDLSFPEVENLQEEDARLAFSYQNRKTFAFGHGISATWEPLEGTPHVIKTTYVPQFDINPMSFTISNINQSVLQPESYLRESNKETQISNLEEFVSAYDKWIEDKAAEIPLYTQKSPTFKKFANENLSKCRTCSDRMHYTIQQLKENNQLLTAFDIANEVLLLQRIEDAGQKEKLFKSRNFSEVQSSPKTAFLWRPFQLAFILTTLTSVVNPEDDYRDIVDLIWVSTGGGKTEAYLFDIALLIIYGRLQDSNNIGVNVIMRYTLRLLTAQQFERAASMICTLEYIRRNDTILGQNQISIGLWVGGNSTPNKVADAKKSLTNMALNHGENVFQILKCPWCKEEHSLVPKKDSSVLANWGYDGANRRFNKFNRFDMKCRTPECPFSNGLPIYVVDEHIYQVQPTLLFGTVDKFAQMPLNEHTDKLLCAKGKNDKIYRPQLILQDELHLISGPLGSIVGLYEAGFDYVLSRNSKVKYLASTATIRNSIDQISNLYDRKVLQFPPDGLKADDSFFVKKIESNKPSDQEGRRYVGIIGTGKSQVTTEVRLFGAMLASIKNLGLTVAEEELFWTVVGYFNSIRELGKAATLLADDVRDELFRIARRQGISVRWIKESVELTSRVSNSKIAETINALEQSHENGKAIDTVIATNMLSVGIDISRLNAMAVIGQPKLTSEYIQATSRVGRASLGLIFTLYNAMRSRDRSHYETFTSYHQSMYRYVEPSSVTPFSQPALLKAIPATIVSMMRHSVPEMVADDAAANVLSHEKELSEVKDFLLTRIQRNDKYNLYTKKASKIISDFIDDWKYAARRTTGKLKYYSSQGSVDPFLLRSFDRNQDAPYQHVAMNSMRDIEETTNYALKGTVGHNE